MGVQINGDTGNVIATKGTFSGDVGIGGTLTYEDVTNVDSVGLITARAGVVVGSGITLSKDGDGFFTGIVTATSYAGSGANLTGIDTDLVSDTSPQLGGNLDVNSKTINLGDSSGETVNRIRLGADNDGDLFHDGTDLLLREVDSGQILLRSDGAKVFANASGSENQAVFTASGSVSLYHAGTIKLSTSSAGVTIEGGQLALNRQDTTNEGGEIVFNRASDNTNQWFNDVYGNDSTAKIRWHHGGAEKISFSTGGDLNIIDGNLHVASGHGIDFSATSDGSGASSVSELLDDYEEGFFTPTWSQGVSSPSYTNQHGAYVKVGRAVNFQINLSINGGTATSDHLKIAGLPFVSGGASSVAYGGAVINYTGATFNVDGGVTLHIGQNDDDVKFYNNNGSSLVGTNNDVNDITSHLIIHGQYMTAS